MPTLQEQALADWMAYEAACLVRARVAGAVTAPPPLVTRETVGPEDHTADVVSATAVRMATPRPADPPPPAPAAPPATDFEPGPSLGTGRRFVCGEPGCGWYVVHAEPLAAGRTLRLHRLERHAISKRMNRLGKDPERRKRRIAQGMRKHWRRAEAHAAAVAAESEAPPTEPA